MAAAAWAVFAWYYRMAKKEFGGITGDLAGWFLATAELAMAAVWCLC
jgi:adenosylcobinamide-GDP ribazoletransferase